MNTRAVVFQSSIVVPETLFPLPPPFFPQNLPIPLRSVSIPSPLPPPPPSVSPRIKTHLRSVNPFHSPMSYVLTHTIPFTRSCGGACTVTGRASTSFLLVSNNAAVELRSVDVKDSDTGYDGRD